MISELFNLKRPIIQGAMATISDVDLVSTVSQQGGLGTLSSFGLTSEQFKQSISEIRKRTDRPFACNIMMNQPNIYQLVNVIIEEKVEIVSISAGFRKDILLKLKKENKKIISVVGSQHQALKVNKLGVDCIVAEGCEAGGHIGNQPLRILLRDILSMTNVPVIAAGGITDSTSLKNYLAVGAAGVQLGTVFLLSEESSLPLNQKIWLINKIKTTKVVSNNEGLKLRGAIHGKDIIPCGIGIKNIDKIFSVEEIFANLFLE